MKVRFFLFYNMQNVVSPIKDRFESIDRRHLVQIGGKKPVEKFAKLRKKLRKRYQFGKEFYFDLFV